MFLISGKVQADPLQGCAQFFAGTAYQSVTNMF